MTRAHRVLLAVIVVFLTSVFVLRYQTNRTAPKCFPSKHDLRATDLRGQWTIELTPDSATQLPTARLRHRLSGSLELTSRDSSSSGVVYTGAYSADFQSVGLFKRNGEVLAFTPRGDTVRIILDPNVDHGNLEIVARCRSDDLAGRWTTNGDPSRAWGRVIIR